METKRPTAMYCRHYCKTLSEQVINKVTGFQQLFKELGEAIDVSNKTKSTSLFTADTLPCTALPHACHNWINEQMFGLYHLIKTNGCYNQLAVVLSADSSKSFMGVFRKINLAVDRVVGNDACSSRQSVYYYIVQ
jgi:hypothetical protein